MPHGPTIFASKGCCIYCGATGVKLGDEHIVPESLGGQHVLKAASCRQCEVITTKFERKVARDLWGDARVAYGAPSKRKKQRKTHIEMFDPDNIGQTISIPAEKYPAAFIFYKMVPAGVLQGLPALSDISVGWQLQTVDDDTRTKKFLVQYPTQKLTNKFRHVPEAFGQLLAKIGYCHILTQLDLGDFHPICLSYIRGEKANISYIVGGSSRDYSPDPLLGYSLTTTTFGSASRLMLMAIIRLYANIHSPVYHVVVGDVSGEAAVSKVLRKLGYASGAEVGLEATELDTHWLPQILPLPFWTQGLGD